MHGRTALIAVVLLLGMVAASVLLLRPPAAPPALAAAPAWLEGLEPSAVRRIEIVRPGQPSAIVEPSDLDGVWVMTQSHPGVVGTPAWPVATAQVRGVIRLIADFAKAPTTDARPPEDSTRVRLAMKDGPWREMLIGSDELAGRVQVAILETGAAGGESQGRLVDAGMARLLRPEGTLAWREPLLFPGGADASTSISLTIAADSAAGTAAPSTPLTATKVQGRWALTSPLAARVEPQTPAGVLLLAARATPRTFIEPAPPDADTGLDRPSLVLTLEIPVNTLQSGDVRRRTLVQKLERGWRDAEGSSFARITGTLIDLATREETIVFGPTVVSVGDEHFAGLSVDPTLWIARTATSMPAADVRRIEIVRGSASSSLIRTIDGWRTQEGSPTESVSGLAPGPLAEAILAWLQRTPAASIEVTPPSAGTTTIRLFGAAPEGTSTEAMTPPAEQYTLESAAGMWRLTSGGVTRLYRGPVAGLERAGLVIE